MYREFKHARGIKSIGQYLQCSFWRWVPRYRNVLPFVMYRCDQGKRLSLITGLVIQVKNFCCVGPKRKLESLQGSAANIVIYKIPNSKPRSADEKEVIVRLLLGFLYFPCLLQVQISHSLCILFSVYLLTVQIPLSFFLLMICMHVCVLLTFFLLTFVSIESFLSRKNYS